RQEEYRGELFEEKRTDCPAERGPFLSDQWKPFALRRGRARGRRRVYSISAPRLRSAGSSAGPIPAVSRRNLARAIVARRSSGTNSGGSNLLPGGPHRHLRRSSHDYVPIKKDNKL